MSIFDRLKRKRKRQRQRQRDTEGEGKGPGEDWENDVFDAIEDIGLATENTKKDIHEIKTDVFSLRQQNEGIKTDVKRLLRSTVDRDPPLDTVIATQSTSAMANREKIVENREGLKEVRDDLRSEVREVRDESRERIKGLDGRVDKLERSFVEADTHSGYARKDLDKAEEKQGKINEKIQDGRVEVKGITTRMAVMWAVAAIIGTLLVSNIGGKAIGAILTAIANLK